MIWKLEACHDEERIGCRWGYAQAETEGEAVARAQASSGLSHVWAHPTHPAKIWPGSPEVDLYWS